jgi:hypothetical protein
MQHPGLSSTFKFSHITQHPAVTVRVRFGLKFGAKSRSSKQRVENKIIILKGKLHPFPLSFVSLETQSYF